MSSQRPGYGSGPAPAGDPRFQQATPPPDPFGEGFSWIMPKTVVSLAVWVLMFGLGAGLSGLMLFVFYQSEINDLRSELLESQQELRNTLEGQIEQLENAPGRNPEASLSVSQVGRDSEEVVERLTESVAPAVAGVRGQNQGLIGTSGSGFVVNSPGGSAWVVTNYSLVAGVDPEVPNTRVRVRHIELSSEVYEVDPGNGLALMIYPDGVSRSLRIAGSPPAEGENLWAVGSSRSSPYAELVQAEVLSIEPNLIVEADVSESFAGGPVIDERGRVHGIIPTLTSAGSSQETVRFTVTPIDKVCARILRCPGSGADQASAGDADADQNETEEAQTGDGAPGAEQPPPPGHEPGTEQPPPPGHEPGTEQPPPGQEIPTG